MHEAVRPAVPADRDVLVELARAARAGAAGQRGGALLVAAGLRPEPLEAALDPAGLGEGTLLLVGTIDEVPVGYALVCDRTLADGSHLGVIEELFVLPGARAVGVGEVLLEEILAWCRARGCTGLDALALPGDRDTKNFFETFGLVARAIVVHRPL